MRSFFKSFFASLLALFVFVLLGVFLLVALAGSFTTKEKEPVAAKSVLLLDLAQTFQEQAQEDPVGELVNRGEGAIPGLYDAVRLIRHAAGDNNIAGIYIKADGNGNGFASSDELRTALLQFKASKKFIIAHGDGISQKAYFVASVADRIYANPVGGLEWDGFSSQLFFIKGALDKLEIQPQIFYAGKFKSATEPLRATQMTPENRLQTAEWLGDLYNYFLVRCAEARKLDTATLHNLANTAAIQTTADAVNAKLLDAARYDDEVKDELKKRLSIGKYDKLNLIAFNAYNDAVDATASGSDRIAVIYAEGDIVDGEGTRENIGGDAFRKLIRKVRLDRSIKAIVLRINSGGGSALASENMWRELELLKEDKPLVVSFGDVAASGGYYMGCGGDSIFASPNTITGSIGVFGVLPNMQAFFNKKLGVTFDGVKTAPYADAGAIYRPVTDKERVLIQDGVNRIYAQFLMRVAAGRKRDTAYINSVAQGRVWSGEDAVRLGLVDKIGSMQDAVDCAARMARSKSYRLREYPQPENWFNQFFDRTTPSPQALIKEEIGAENFRIYQQLLQVKEWCGTVQARLPYTYFID